MASTFPEKLVNELKQRVEELESANKYLRSAGTQYILENDELKKENERLKQKFKDAYDLGESDGYREGYNNGWYEGRGAS